MKIIITIDNRFKALNDFIKFLKTLTYIKKIEVEKTDNMPTNLLKNAINELESKESIKLNGDDQLSKMIKNAKK